MPFVAYIQKNHFFDLKKKRLSGIVEQESNLYFLVSQSIVLSAVYEVQIKLSDLN